MSQSPTPITPPSATPRPSRFTPLDPLRITRQYTWLWVIMGTIGIGLGILATVLFQIFMPEYTSKSTLLVSAELQDVFAPTIDPSGIQERQDALSTFMLNQVLRIQSQQVLDRALESQKVKNTEWFKKFPRSSRDAFESLAEDLTVKVLRGSSLIEVAFSGPEEEDMATIVDVVNKSFLEQYRIDLRNRQTNVRVMMSQELHRAREELDEIEKELEAYLQEHDVPRLDTKGTEAHIAYEKLAERRILLELTFEQMQQQYAELQRDLQDPLFNERPEISASRDLDPKLQARIAQLEQMEQGRALLALRLGPNHRMMKQLDEDMSVVRAGINKMRDEMIRSSNQSILTGAQRNIERIFLQIESLKPKLDEARENIRELDSKLSEYARMGERREAVQSRYERAEELLEDIRVRELRPENIRIQVQQQPTIAELTFPRYFTMVPGVTLLVLVLTASLVFVKETLDQRIKSPSDLALVPDATLLGVIPSTTEDPTGPESVEGIVHKDPTGLIAEAFRQVRTEILSSMDRRGYKSLMVVGAQAECGTSAMVANLAASITFNGRKVVVIDANFRRPAQCRLFGAQTTPGLVEILKGEVTLEEAMVHYDDPKLDVIPAGDSLTAPPEILESDAFRNLLARIENEADVILIDAPPALVASDSKLLTKQVDALVLVIRAKSEKRGMVSRILRELDGQRADLLGVLLNGVKSSTGGYFRKNYQAFYRYRQHGKRDKPEDEPTESAPEPAETEEK
ncbi:MAG: hypothetical protein CMJ18_20405 [Phycisphaeraceae bacterium]|nr:hypothetical protein [Phycisphaeraceae bacterium]